MVEQPVLQGEDALKYRGNHNWFVLGRLKPGVTPSEATSGLNPIGVWLSKTYPADDDGLTFTLARPGLMGDALGKPARAFMSGLMILAVLILLAACANLGSLFAARAVDRTKEVALRLVLIAAGSVTPPTIETRTASVSSCHRISAWPAV